MRKWRRREQDKHKKFNKNKMKSQDQHQRPQSS